MQALAASCEELHARTGNPPLDEFFVSNVNSANYSISGISANFLVSLALVCHESINPMITEYIIQC